MDPRFTLRPPPFRLKPDDAQQLKALGLHHRYPIEMRVMEQNLAHTACVSVRPQMAAHLAWLTMIIETFDTQSQTLIKAYPVW